MTDEQRKAARPAETTHWSASDEQVEDVSNATSLPDEAIAQEVAELLAEDAKIDLANVNVSVNAGEVTLEGYAARLSDKTHAEEVVLDLDGVNAVQNNLRIAPERH